MFYIKIYRNNIYNKIYRIIINVYLSWTERHSLVKSSNFDLKLGDLQSNI